MKTIIIGAGLAGLACARELAKEGHRVTVIDKGRGPGGRTSTRRAEASGRAIRFDHGAQYFTARAPAFQRQVEAWQASSVAAEWRGHIVVLDRGTRTATSEDVTRYVGVPSMSMLTRELGSGLDVRYGLRATEARRSDGGWWVTTEAGETMGPFDALVLATPAPQTAPLLNDAATLQARVAAVTMTPCLAAMVAFPNRLATGFDGAFVSSSPVAWAARDSSKPDRADSLDCWVLHATPAWSQAQFDTPPPSFAAALLAGFTNAVGMAMPEPVHVAGHRWGFARTENPIGDLSVLDDASRVVVCGDWCPGARVEGAYLSGLDAARRLLASQTIAPS